MGQQGLTCRGLFPKLSVISNSDSMQASKAHSATMFQPKVPMGAEHWTYARMTYCITASSIDVHVYLLHSGVYGWYCRSLIAAMPVSRVACACRRCSAAAVLETCCGAGWR